jgi:hypothetical protein
MPWFEPGSNHNFGINSAVDAALKTHQKQTGFMVISLSERNESYAVVRTTTLG